MKKLVALLALWAPLAFGQGAVRMWADASCNWTTWRADGTVLGTAADVQPAINEAQGSGAPLVVYGRRQCPLNVSTTTVFGPANGSSYDLRNVYLNSTANPVVKIDTLYVSSLEWSSGKITYTGPAVTTWPSMSVHIAADNPIPDPGPDEPLPIFKFSNVRLPYISTNAAIYTVVFFSEDVGGIVNNRFKFDMVNGNCNATNGIVVKNPLNFGEQSAFVQNHIDVGLVDAFTGSGISEGIGPRLPGQPMGTNIYTGAITSSCPGEHYAYFWTAGVMNQAYWSSYSVNVGTMQFGTMFGAGSAGNWVVSPQVQAAHACWNNGASDNKCVTP